MVHKYLHTHLLQVSSCPGLTLIAQDSTCPELTLQNEGEHLPPHNTFSVDGYTLIHTPTFIDQKWRCEFKCHCGTCSTGHLLAIAEDGNVGYTRIAHSRTVDVIRDGGDIMTYFTLWESNDRSNWGRGEEKGREESEYI